MALALRASFAVRRRSCARSRHPLPRGEWEKPHLAAMKGTKEKGPEGPFVVPSTGSLPEEMPYSGRTSTRTRMRSPGL
jgi:hypothetical protein